MAIDNKPLTDAELGILIAAGYAPAGGGNLAGDGVIVLRFRKDGRVVTNTRGGWRRAIADLTRLNAAAPDLLAACEHIMDLVEAGECSDGYAAGLVRAAIAKARGTEADDGKA